MSIFMFIIGYVVAVVFPMPFISSFVLSQWSKLGRLVAGSAAPVATPVAPVANSVVSGL